MLQTFLNDEAGFVISSELVLIVTIGVLAMIVGLSEVAVAVNNELNDISNGIGSLNQTFRVTGFAAGDGGGHGKDKSSFAGSTFTDAIDDCDTNTTCALVCGVANISATEGGL